MANEVDTTLLDNLNSIKNSKADIKQALIDKGQNPTNVFANYAQLIENIQTGEDLSEELSAQEAKLAQLENILDNKTAGIDLVKDNSWIFEGTLINGDVDKFAIYKGKNISNGFNLLNTYVDSNYLNIVVKEKDINSNAGLSNMGSLFYGKNKIQTVDISNLNTSMVSNIRSYVL